MSETFYTTTPAVLKREFQVERIVDHDGVELDDHRVIHVSGIRLDRKRYGEVMLRAASVVRISSIDQPGEGQSTRVTLDPNEGAPAVRVVLVPGNGDGLAV